VSSKTNPEAMPQSLSKVYTHIIFSTKHRRNLIDDAIEPELFNYLGGICKALECDSVQVGGYRNHVHILCLLSRKIAQMNLLEEVKKRTSKWIKTRNSRYSDFYWQDGYGVFSVKPSDSERVAGYIRNQKEHHEKMTFKQELRKFLEKYHVDYDERYVWD
jgi:putative transposase